MGTTHDRELTIFLSLPKLIVATLYTQITSKLYTPVVLPNHLLSIQSVDYPKLSKYISYQFAQLITP